MNILLACGDAMVTSRSSRLSPFSKVSVMPVVLRLLWFSRISSNSCAEDPVDRFFLLGGCSVGEVWLLSSMIVCGTGVRESGFSPASC